jgi:hypothetical protein
MFNNRVTNISESDFEYPTNRIIINTDIDDNNEKDNNDTQKYVYLFNCILLIIIIIAFGIYNYVSKSSLDNILNTNSTLINITFT